MKKFLSPAWLAGILILLAFLGLAVSLPGCGGIISWNGGAFNGVQGSGKAATETRPVGDFSKIDLAPAAEDIDVTVGQPTFRHRDHG